MLTDISRRVARQPTRKRLFNVAFNIEDDNEFNQEAIPFSRIRTSELTSINTQLTQLNFGASDSLRNADGSNLVLNEADLVDEPPSVALDNQAMVEEDFWAAQLQSCWLHVVYTSLLYQHLLNWGFPSPLFVKIKAASSPKIIQASSS